MADVENQKRLQKRLKELDESIKNILNTRSYSKEVAKIRILEQMIKEQLKSENTCHSTGSSR